MLEHRPRCNYEQNRVVQAMKQGWKPDLSGIELSFDLENNKQTPAKVLVFDIETAPLRSYTWGVWQQDVPTPMIISDWFMLTWSAKWLFDDEIMSDAITPEEVAEEDDKRITKSIWKLLNEADIVIAHNAKKFDIKKVNSRFLLNGLNPPMPYQVIDTLLHLRGKFSLSSNKLDYVNKLLGIERKMDTGGFALWDGCIRGDQESLDKMEEYNRVDVSILEETYLKIRSWIQPHPNMGLFIEDDVERCPACGGQHINFSGTPYRTAVSAFASFRCLDCGSVGRSRTNISKKQGGPVVSTTSVPR